MSIIGRRFLGWLALVLALLAILVPLAALTFSVRVQGSSMSPTLAQGDRLFVNFLGRGDVQRFDVVEVQFDRTAARAVKRVIGMPGDRISVSMRNGRPVVSLQPAGDGTTYVVDNPSWVDQVGTEQRTCCTDAGKAIGETRVVTVPTDSYWVVGDNWGGSDDSRKYGFVPRERVGARLGFRLLPLGDFGPVDDDVRLAAR